MVLDKRVADCAALAALTGTELFYADNSGSDVKVTSSAVRVFAYPPVNVRDFGAAGDAIVSTAGSVYTVTPVTNDTTAIQAALTFGATFTPPRPVYIPAGYYYISNRLTLAAGQTLFAESPHSGFLAMNGSFNLATDGVVKFGANCSVRDLGFLFQQAPTATRATAIQYPAAIRASGDFPKVDNVFIAGAWVGIDCTYHSVDNTQGNGFRVKNVEVGALHTGFAANYSFDFAMVDNFHGKPFGMATASDALGAAYRDGNQYAVDLMSNLHETTDDTYGLGSVSLCEIWTLRGIVNLGRFTTTTVDTLKLDSGQARIIMGGTDCVVHISTLTKSAAGPINNPTTDVGDFCIRCNGGTNNVLHVKGYDIGTHDHDTPFVEIIDTNAKFTQGVVPSAGPNNAVFRLNCSASSAGSLVLTDTLFRYTSSQAYTVSPVQQVLGRLTMHGNRFGTRTSGSGNILSLATDARHVITPNDFNGWDVSLPSGMDPPTGVYWPNIGSGAGWDVLWGIAYAPTITGSVSNPTVSYTTRNGYYTISSGKLIEVSVNIVINTISGGSGSVRVTLPFACKSNANYFPSCTALVRGINWGVGKTMLVLSPPAAGAATVTLFGIDNDGTYTAVPVANLSAGDEIYFSMIYTTDAAVNG